ncbi:hypothetical protein CBS101457_006756 [Exobasidium rhododendri]|nr:hypothetical protein CBS101457_006756 [Exobasidium rhododendri]
MKLLLPTLTLLLSSFICSVLSAPAKEDANQCRVYNLTPEQEESSGMYFKILETFQRKDDTVALGGLHVQHRECTLNEQNVKIGFLYSPVIIQNTVESAESGSLSKEPLKWTQFKYTYIFNDKRPSISFWLDTATKWCSINPATQLKSFDANKVDRVQVYRRVVSMTGMST